MVVTQIALVSFCLAAVVMFILFCSVHHDVLANCKYPTDVLLFVPKCLDVVDGFILLVMTLAIGICWYSTATLLETVCTNL